MEMRKAVNQFLNEFQNSSAFRDYKYQKERIKKVPGMKDRINEFRKKRFEFQKYQGEDLFEKIDEFQREYQAFKEEPIVREYLAAELEICRLVQQIYGAIDELVDIDMEME
ncbi:MAG: YlbF family regulator [Lachnospiraceae bacterium]|nr:YlbF family regulator [Lachnospiraceae bacterium]MBR5316825.1 YlbF family regulator [Lachnospiraceae bacterium]